MDNEKAIEIFNKWMDCKDAYQADPSCDGNCFSCEYYASAEEEKEAMQMAISALEKQEQTNTQSVNSTHTSRPNALESLNILEQAKDDKGSIPMSLVRLAFRNVFEQDRWIPVAERLPEEKDAGILKKLGTNKRSDYVLATVEVKGERMTVTACTYDGKWDWNMKYAFPDYKIIAWRPLPEPYQEDDA